MGVGDALVFRLTENASTGYRWQVAEIAPPLLVLKEKRVGSPGRALGGPAEILMSLEARSTGDARVTLGLSRAWEANAAPAKSISVSVSIR